MTTETTITATQLRSRREAADYLGVSPQTLAVWACNTKGGVPPSGVRAEGVGFAVGALQGPHGGRDQEVIGELR